jgi:hypothetical protein
MRAFGAFLKKEFLEGVRMYKTIIIAAVFVIFGIMSPITAKMIPVIFEMVDMGGLVMNIPEPTAIDSYGQFFSNIGQIGVIVFFIVLAGTLNGEISKGTLIIGITRGLSRKSVIIAKYISAMTVWTVSLTVSAVITFFYTEYLFTHDTVQNVLLSIFCLWLFGALMTAVLMFASVITKGTFMPLLLLAGVGIGMSILELFPKISRHSPMRLSMDNVSMLTGQYELSGLTVPMILSGALIVVLMSVTLVLFDKKQL